MLPFLLLLPGIPALLAPRAAQAQWASAAGNTANDVAVAPNGDVIVTGVFSTQDDFDPGPGVASMDGYGVYVASYTFDGTFEWVERIFEVNSIATGSGNGLFVDNSGQIYVTGTGLDSHAFVASLSPDGRVSWVEHLGEGDGVSRGRAVVATDDGQVLVTGMFSGDVDFDPGPDTNLFEVSNSGSGGFVSILDTNGAFQSATWLYPDAEQSDGTDLAVTPEGTVLVSGFNWADDIMTFVREMDTDGAELFSFEIETGSVLPAVLDVAADGDILLGGGARGRTDFDPGDGVFELESSSLENAYLARYTSAGELEWAFVLDGGSSFTDAQVVQDVVVGPDGNAFASGYFRGPTDFDPSEAEDLKTPYDSGHDAFIARYDTAGELEWSLQVGADDADEGRGLALGPTGALVAAGLLSRGAVDFDPGADQYVLEDIRGFVASYNTNGEFVASPPPDDTAIQEDPGLPGDVSISDAWPNPFSARTSVRISLGRTQPVRVDVFDATGRRVGRVFDGLMAAGVRTLDWSDNSQPVGVYFIRIQIKGSSVVRMAIRL